MPKLAQVRVARQLFQGPMGQSQHHQTDHCKSRPRKGQGPGQEHCGHHNVDGQERGKGIVEASGQLQQEDQQNGVEQHDQQLQLLKQSRAGQPPAPAPKVTPSLQADVGGNFRGDHQEHGHQGNFDPKPEGHGGNRPQLT